MEAKSHRTVLINKWEDESHLEKLNYWIKDSDYNIKQTTNDAVKNIHQTAKGHYLKELSQVKQVIKKEVDVIKKIQKEASNYLNIFDTIKKVLFRGTRPSGVIFESASIEKRRTVDSDIDNTIAYDKNLKLLGIEARRSNSIFTTSDEGQAQGYGELDK